MQGAAGLRGAAVACGAVVPVPCPAMYLTLGFLCEVEVECKVLDVASTLQTVSRIPRWVCESAAPPL